MNTLLRADLAHLKAYSAHDMPGGDKLDANEIPYPLPDWFQAQIKVAGHRYPAPDPETLRDLLGAYCSVPSDWITVGNGSDELIRSLLLVSVLGTGRWVITCEPTFGMYKITAQTLGIPFQGLERTSEFQLDLEKLAHVCATEPVGVIFLAHPNSPTGTPLTETELNFLRQLPQHILIVIDEAYFEFSGSTALPSLSKHPNWVILRTLSKAFRLAAYRVGYAVAQPTLIQALEKVRLPYNLTTASQQAAQLALTHREQLLAIVPEIVAARDHLTQALQHLPIQIWPSVGNFLFLRVPEPQLLHTALAERGSLVRYTSGGLRVTIGTPAENQRLLANLRAIL